MRSNPQLRGPGGPGSGRGAAARQRPRRRSRARRRDLPALPRSAIRPAARAIPSRSRRRSRGSSPWWISKQLESFKSGVRGTNPEDTAGLRMYPMSQTLKTPEDIAAVTAYVASLPSHEAADDVSPAAIRRAARSSTRSARPATAPTAAATRRSARRRSPTRATGTCCRRSRSTRPASARAIRSPR